MTNEVSRLFGAEERKMETRERDGRPATVVVASRRYETTAEDLWDAVTNPARIPRWFLPVTGDLRLGGRYQLQGNAGGTITRCEPPNRFEATWEYGGDVTWIDVTLTPHRAGGTTIRLEHIAHVTPERAAEFGPGAVGVGWDMGFMGLGNHLGGGGIDPSAAMAWLASEDGKAFVVTSSEAWILASIAAGTDPAEARAAGDRTTVAYGATPPGS